MSKARACEYIPCYLPGVRYTKADGGSVVGMLSLAIFNTKDAATEAAASILERREEDRRRCAQIPGYQISKPLPETEAVAYPATIERRPDVADVLRPDYAWAKSGGRAN